MEMAMIPAPDPQPPSDQALPLQVQVHQVPSHQAPAMEPLVSVLMLTHNHGAFLQQAIDSVIAQTLFDRCELLIGEDGSTDQTAAVAWAAAAAYPGRICVFESGAGPLGFHRNFERLATAERMSKMQTAQAGHIVDQVRLADIRNS